MKWLWLIAGWCCGVVSDVLDWRVEHSGYVVNRDGSSTEYHCIDCMLASLPKDFWDEFLN